MKYYAAMLHGGAKTAQEKYAAELKAWELEPAKKPAEEASVAGAEGASATDDGEADGPA